MYLNVSAKNPYKNLEQSRLEFDFAQLAAFYSSTQSFMWHGLNLTRRSEFELNPGFM